MYNSHLLAPALEGLGKFGHLINFDTVSDLLVVLKRLLKDVDSVCCTIIVSYQGERHFECVFIMMGKNLFKAFSLSSIRIITDDGGGKNTELAIKCLHAAFMRRKGKGKKL